MLEAVRLTSWRNTYCVPLASTSATDTKAVCPIVYDSDTDSSAPLGVNVVAERLTLLSTGAVLQLLNMMSPSRATQIPPSQRIMPLLLRC